MNPALDTNIIVLNQEHCLHPELRNLETSSCLYGGLGASGDGTTLQVSAPIQFLEADQTRLPPPHLTNLQPIHYSQVGGYEGSQLVYSPSLHPSQFLQSLGLPQVIHPVQPPSVPQPAQPAQLEQTFPNDSYLYYSEISSFLDTGQHPPGVSNTYKTRLTKKAEHYIVINGVLHYNRKLPKRVVMKKEEQTEILQQVHIVEESGVHLGVKKMYNILKKDLFWREMYLDTVNFVKKCTKCSDIEDLARHLNNDLESPDQSGFCKGTQTVSVIWQNLELEVHGPFTSTPNGNDLVVTLTDPESKFVIGQCAKSVGSLRGSIHNFVTTMSLLGMADICVVAKSQQHSEEIITLLKTELSALAPLSNVNITNSHAAQCTWLSQLLSLLISSKPDRWDTELETYLYEWRVSGGNKYSPFCLMFPGRSPLFCLPDDKENLDNSSKGSDDENESINGDEGSCRGLVTGHNGCALNKEIQLEAVQEFKPSELDVENTVTELKAFLSETKDVRRKRGKYHKYNPEMQELMIDFALKKGSRKASQHFSKTLEMKVSESTIRNLIKSHLNLRPNVKEEIGQYAATYGIEKACRYFSAKMHQNIPMNFVRKLQTIYLNKVARKANEEAMKRRPNMETLSEKVKYDIGTYASNHTPEETVKHFMEKGIELDEQLVINVSNYMQSKNNLNSQPNFTTGEVLENNSYLALLEQPLDKSLEFNESVCLPVSNCQIEGITYDSCSTNESGQNINTLDPNNSESTSNDKTAVQNEKGAEIEEEKTKDDNKDEHPNKVKEVGRKRRQYSHYSPELRAEIGKYAATHGSLQASNYFSQLLDRDIPESTARGLREKYLQKSKFINVTSLGFSQRGRPLRLGKYDEAVQECIKELVRTGEKVSAYLAITTAKRILNKFEPGLLKENGGSVVLNTTWAKSFLKRIGVRNNS